MNARAFAPPSVPAARPWLSLEASVRTVAIKASAEIAGGAPAAGDCATAGAASANVTSRAASSRCVIQQLRMLWTVPSGALLQLVHGAVCGLQRDVGRAAGRQFGHAAREGDLWLRLFGEPLAQ